MSRYAEIYSVYGLTEMIRESEEKILKLGKEREDVGLTWTEMHINHHKENTTKEIEDVKGFIGELKEALELGKSTRKLNFMKN